jgi:F-type H+-transporting ATPase subunit c
MMIGLAMIESLAIYVFVVAMIILFANPFVDTTTKLSIAQMVGQTVAH